jgi:succinyl-CoA synthetase beta subunit
MKLFEYQAKAAFAEAGIPVPRSALADGIEEVEKAVANVGAPCVVKAQVLRGGARQGGAYPVCGKRRPGLGKSRRSVQFAFRRAQGSG